MALSFPSQHQSKGSVEKGAEIASELFSAYPDLLTPKHISEITGMSVQYARTLCRTHQLPSVLIGKSRWYVPKTRFIAYIMGGDVE